MDIPAAVKLIHDTFRNPFDRGRFTFFIRNLLNYIDDSKPFIYRGNIIPDAYKPYVHTFERIGKYTDTEGNKIDILTVHLKRETSLIQARTRQRNFISWYLNGSRGGVLKEAALVAFYTDHPEDWRFSLIKMEYKLGETKAGRITARPELTPARRFSFLVGQNETSHTAQTSFLKFLEDDDRRPTLNQLEEAFSIEKVTKEFFEKYHILFNDLQDALDDIVMRNEAVRKDFTGKGVDTVNFAKKTLGQIVFLYFLQKKGWFGVARDKDWGTGPKNFLRRLFEEKKYANFFNDILEPLFYEALARERDQNYYSRFNCKIPFLNGGLFDPINEYDWVHADILLPDELFSNDHKTKEGDTGTGILDVFDRYNFTVKEDEPLEREVAVDPEMLGKVFENLLEVKDRKSKGTYYTPREIVHYMCRESLISYLDAELAGAEGDLFFDREDVEFLIRFGELIRENDARVQKEGKETRDYLYKVPASIRDRADLIDEKLANIRVCDPAVGSGAFLVGMMTEIVKARQTLSTYIEAQGQRSPYAFKRQAIQNSLYGVDIDPGAVEIAKLRLWLSLIVDEEDILEIKPLPNLDYKIMQGNSLLEEFEGIRLFDEKLIMDTPSDETALLKQEAKRKQTALQREYFRLRAAGLLTSLKKQELEFELQEQAAFLKKLSKRVGKILKDTPLFDSDAKKKADELRQLHKEFFESSQKSRKDAIKTRIEAIEWELIEATLTEQNKTATLEGIGLYKKANVRPFFLWKFHFAEVFQEKNGFDIVIGNPPYVRADSGEDHLTMRRSIEKSGQYQTLWEKWDIYIPFIERGYQLLKPGGVTTMIVSDAFCHSKYAQKAQTWFLKNACVLRLDFFSKIQIFDAGVRNITYLFRKDDGARNRPERRRHEPAFGMVRLLPTDEQQNLTFRAFFPEEEANSHFTNPTLTLADICYISYGLRPSSDEHEAKGEFVTDDLVSETQDNIHPKAFVEGKHLDCWCPATNLWIEWGTERAPSRFCRPTFTDMYEVTEKILAQRSPGHDPKVCYDDHQLIFTPSSVGFIPWHSLAGVRNNSLKKAARYTGEKPPRPDLPRREYLEKTSRRFAIKYLLAVMNSAAARDFLRANRRSNIHLYPDDWKQLPIPEATPEQQGPLIRLVDQILIARRADPYADISAIEGEINILVNHLYGLSTENSGDQQKEI